MTKQKGLLEQFQEKKSNGQKFLFLASNQPSCRSWGPTFSIAERKCGWECCHFQSIDSDLMSIVLHVFHHYKMTLMISVSLSWGIILIQQYFQTNMILLNQTSNFSSFSKKEHNAKLTIIKSNVKKTRKYGDLSERLDAAVDHITTCWANASCGG